MTWKFETINYTLILGNGTWEVEESITPLRINIRKNDG